MSADFGFTEGADFSSNHWATLQPCLEKNLDPGVRRLGFRFG